jgi:hypothetical protein
VGPPDSTSTYTTLHGVKTNAAGEWLTLLLRIREILGLNLGPKIDYPNQGFFRDFHQSLQTNPAIDPQIRPQPLPSTFFPILHFVTFLPFHATVWTSDNAVKPQRNHKIHSVTRIRQQYSNPSLILSKWEERSSGLVKQKVALKDRKKLRTQINEKFNDISSADENK